MRARIPQMQRLRTAPSRRGHERPVRTDLALEIHPLDPEARVREAGGPEDRAQYSCGCGMVFQAPVSASVACPHCGSGQAW